MLTEHVFGGALPKLPLDGDALWEQLQITVPAGQKPVFDQQTEYTQPRLVRQRSECAQG